jgi:phosphoglycolate phosphatase-like HAD superfamily hydrolase
VTRCALLFDFDGTVSVGDEPVIAFARHLDEEAGSAAGLITRVVARWLAADGRLAQAVDGATDADPAYLGLHVVAGSVDGYAAARRLAELLGVGGEQIRAAYSASRDDLARGLISTRAPEGFASFLAAFPASARRVLVSNSPERGLREQLARLELARSFDELVTDAGEPEGMRRLAERLAAEHGLAPERIVAVGGTWAGGLAPVAELGGATALVERLPVPEDARPTVRTAQIENLYEWLLKWART